MRGGRWGPKGHYLGLYPTHLPPARPSYLVASSWPRSASDRRGGEAVDHGLDVGSRDPGNTETSSEVDLAAAIVQEPDRASEQRPDLGPVGHGDAPDEVLKARPRRGAVGSQHTLGGVAEAVIRGRDEVVGRHDSIHLLHERIARVDAKPRSVRQRKSHRQALFARHLVDVDIEVGTGEVPGEPAGETHERSLSNSDVNASLK